VRRISFIQGSFIVASFNIFVGFIVLIYNVLLSKHVGAEGVGLFQMASSVLTPFLIITTAGIPTAVSRLVAEGSAPQAGRRIFSTAVMFSLALSVGLGLLLTSLTGVISSRLFGNDSLRSCLYLTVPSVVIISLTSVFRGYLYGLRLMTAAGVSEIIEHLTRFLFVIGFLAYVPIASPLHGAKIAVCGIFVGELADLLWLMWVEKRASARLWNPGVPDGYPTATLGALLDIAGPLTLTSLSSTIMQSINAILIPQRLMAAGFSASAATADFGRLTGMVLPLVFLPFTLTSAIVVNLIPNLSAQYAAKNLRSARRIVRQALAITLLVSMPLAVLYITLAEPMGAVVYHDAEVSGLIRAMGGSTVLLALQHTFSGVLSGIGRQSRATLHRLAGLSIQLFAAYFLVGDPRFGISGYAVSFFLYVLVICALDYRAIQQGLSLAAPRHGHPAAGYFS
jgi:stage V sporulation protein B